MQIDVKELEFCKLAIHYESDAEEILNKRAEVLNAFKKAPVKGFRPGKASLEAIKIHYRSQIEDSLKRALAENAYHNTLFEKKLRPHGAPQFNSLLFEDGKFSCDFDLFTKPDFELAPFQGIDIPKPPPQASIEETVELMLQDLRIKYGEAIPYTETDFVQDGDNLIIDYEGFLDGERVEKLCAQGEMLTVGNSLLKDFDSNLMGMNLGEIREFDILVPENGLPSLAGKTCHLKVTLVMGSKTTPHPLNDDLAVKVNKKNYNELRQAVFSMSMGKISAAEKKAANDAVSARLISENKFEVPNRLTLSEAQYLVHQSKLDWNVLTDSDKERYLELAEKNVKLSLILDKVRENEPSAQLTDQEVFNIIKQNIAATKAQISVDDIIKEMNRTGYMQILFTRIRDEYTLDFISKAVKFVE